MDAERRVEFDLSCGTIDANPRLVLADGARVGLELECVVRAALPGQPARLIVTDWRGPFLLQPTEETDASL